MAVVLGGRCPIGWQLSGGSCPGGNRPGGSSQWCVQGEASEALASDPLRCYAYSGHISAVMFCAFLLRNSQ